MAGAVSGDLVDEARRTGLLADRKVAACGGGVVRKCAIAGKPAGRQAP